MADKSSRSNRPKWVNFLVESTIILGAIAIGLMVRQGLYETMIVTSGSMEPSLAVDARFLVDHRDYLHGQWRRGDIITFHCPETWGGDDDTLVKRVIGLPGERVELRDGQIYIDNKPLNETYLAEKPEPESVGPITLGDHEYFVMGDNRNHSDDSRLNGPIQDSDIRGRVVLRLWPFTNLGRLPALSYSSPG